MFQSWQRLYEPLRVFTSLSDCVLVSFGSLLCVHDFPYRRIRKNACRLLQSFVQPRPEQLLSSLVSGSPFDVSLHLHLHPQPGSHVSSIEMMVLQHPNDLDLDLDLDLGLDLDLHF